MARRRASAVRLEGSLGYVTRAGTLGGAGRIALLEQIGLTGSITAAAKAAGLSYKGAWDAVELMNNLADQPLVARVVGGKGGGGTQLTARGQQIVASYRAAEEEHAHFLAALNRRLDHAEGDLKLLGRLFMQTSARNQFWGRVVALHHGAVNDEIEIELKGGQRIAAVITHQSTQSLGLALGAEALALIKASWVILAVNGDSRPLKLSARNQLPGTVKAITPGAVNSEVILELAGGDTLVAVVTNDSVEELGLAPGHAATALFKASSVILGVAG